MGQPANIHLIPCPMQGGTGIVGEQLQTTCTQMISVEVAQKLDEFNPCF